MAALTLLLKLPWTNPSASSSALKLRLNSISSSRVKPAASAWYFSTMDQRECSRISRRTSLTDNSHDTSSPLEGAADQEMAQPQGEKEKNNSLAEFLRFNKDVEVGFLELLCKHGEDVGGGGEISQRVDDQVEEQL